MFNILKLGEQLRAVKEKMEEAQERLRAVEIKGEAGGGLVKVTVNGARQLLSVEVDKNLCRVEERDALGDLVVAAVNQAMQEAERRSKEILKEHTEGILPQMSGLDLSAFLK